MKLRTVFATLVALLLTLGVAGALGYWKYMSIQKGMKAGPPPEMPEAIVIATAEARPFQRTFNAVGTVQAIRYISVATEVSGKVTSVGYESGQPIDADAVI